MPTVTNIAVTNELGVVAYGVVAWTQRGVPTVTNIAVTNEDVGSSKSEGLKKMEQFKIDQLEANLERFKIDNSEAAKQWAFLQATIEKNKVEADRQFA
ncbi:hypothetical protein Tco_1189992, partial [Tanacetum coccineum]